MATLRPLYKNYYSVAAITIFSFHLVQYSATTTTTITDINNNNGGFSAHLIRSHLPNSPSYKHKNNKRRLMDPNTPGFPLATDSGAGHIFKFSMGTPPIDIHTVADTGSTFLWTQCMPCKTCYETKYAMFDPSKSKTYRNITCSEKECRHADELKLPNDPPNFCRENPTERCPYGLSYGDKSTSKGVLAKETITLTSRTGETKTLQDIILGCGFSNTETRPTGNKMGVIGFGRGPLSFVSQVAPYVGGNKFSHCLVPLETDPKIESKINFGNGSEVSGEGVVSTRLVPAKAFYVVMAEGITIGNEYVSFNSNVTPNNKTRMIIDSGSTLTTVPKHIFDRVTTALNKTLDPKLKSSIIVSEEDGMLYCFNSTTIPKEPKMSFHFEGGGELKLETENMFIKYDEEENTVCFGIRHRAGSGLGEAVGIYGAVMQGNMLIGFDMDREEVSFKPTDCRNY